jgi:nucleoside-diphosphate-sugar epimerase
MVWNLAAGAYPTLDFLETPPSTDITRGPCGSQAKPIARGSFALIAKRSAYVTGGGGFIGTALCSFLTGRGWDVQREPMRLMAEPEKWRAAMSSVNCVVHLAARVHQMGAERDAQDAYDRINVEGSRFVAQQAASAGVRRLVFLSSIKVNGEGGEVPYRATDEPAPCDPYANSKLAAEQVIREVCAGNDMEWVIIRPPLVYGPGVKANFHKLMRLVDLGIPLPFESIRNRRSLLGVTNLVQFIETSMIHPEAARQVWLVADDECISTPELLRRLSRHMHRKSRLFPFSPSWLRRLATPFGLGAEIDRLCDSLQIDASPASMLLGWRPTSSMDAELANTVAEFRASRNQRT